MEPLNLFEYEEHARERLAEMAWAYFASGANDGITLAANRAAFDAATLHYRVLTGVTDPALAVEVLGDPLGFPVLVAPMAFQRLAHPDGEEATVRGAGAVGAGMILSTLATTDVETVVQAASGPVWFQLYVYRDREATAALVRRAETAGATALVLTVDAPRLGRREPDIRTGFHLPPPLSPRNLGGTEAGSLPPRPEGSGLATYFESLLDPGLTWADVDWLRGLTSLPVLLKGIVRPDDARRAVNHGAAGLVVSNHGGRQLDTAPATLSVLPGVAAAVGHEVPVLLDGGVRRGTDVLKALALGADAVLLGRPVLWGLAVDGEAGVRRVLDLLRDELRLAMLLAGCADVRDLPDDLVVGPARG